jgi:hypothetical protein
VHLLFSPFAFEPFCRTVAHEFQFVVGMLQYVQARLAAPATLETARQSRHLQVQEGGVGCSLELHCGHNAAFETDEKAKLRALIEQATAQTGQAVQQMV